MNRCPEFLAVQVESLLNKQYLYITQGKPPVKLWRLSSSGGVFLRTQQRDLAVNMEGGIIVVRVSRDADTFSYAVSPASVHYESLADSLKERVRSLVMEQSLPTEAWLSDLLARATNINPNRTEPDA